MIRLITKVITMFLGGYIWSFRLSIVFQSLISRKVMHIGKKFNARHVKIRKGNRSMGNKNMHLTSREMLTL